MRKRRLLIGSIVGALAGGLLCLLIIAAAWLVRPDIHPPAGAFIYPSLILVPLVCGLAAAWVWSPLKLTISQSALHSLSCISIAMLGAAVFLREGVICLLIVSPLFYLLVFTGACLGRIWFGRDRTKLNLALFPLLGLLALSETATRMDETAVVTDEIVIHTTADKIWPHVTSFSNIPAEPHFWLFRLGLPMPMSTRNSGDFVGADRQCIFNQNAVFREKIAELEPARKLTFDIVEQPPDPELVGHLTAERGQFLLRDNQDGTTTLIGSTWYTLHVRPLWYFDWWTRYIFRAVHLRVMENVRREAEAAG